MKASGDGSSRARGLGGKLDGCVDCGMGLERSVVREVVWTGAGLGCWAGVWTVVGKAEVGGCVIGPCVCGLVDREGDGLVGAAELLWAIWSRSEG
ncbi:hypothetical protein LIER_36911 [Lithospermum erythrorhizon]|uniref:Uncharacterized protein n=1 Tax=Lithospermum erythrorhizon TaxID=34254 RepID=A0AAV3PCJ1_LITER